MYYPGAGPRSATGPVKVLRSSVGLVILPLMGETRCKVRALVMFGDGAGALPAIGGVQSSTRRQYPQQIYP